MRKVLLSLAAAPLLLSAVASMPGRADAMTLAEPAIVVGQTGTAGLLQQVDCRRVWRCGYSGCGWRETCWRDRDDLRFRDRDEWREHHRWWRWWRDRD
jgi:hypothetical protein